MPKLLYFCSAARQECLLNRTIRYWGTEEDQSLKIRESLVLTLILALSVLLLPVSGTMNATYQISAVGQINSFALSWLHSDGNLIKDQDGRVIRLMGCGIETPCEDFYYGGMGVTESWIQAISSYGANCVRVFFSGQYVTNPTYMQYLDNIGSWCKKYNVYCYFNFACETHPQFWGDDAKRAALSSPTWIEKWIGWLETLARHFINEPTMMGIGIFNEPVGDNATMHQAWWTNALACCRRIHAVNPNLLCFVGRDDYQKDFNYFFMDGGYGVFPEPNIVYAWHRYYHYDIIYEIPAYGSNTYAYHYKSGDLANAKTMWQQALYHDSIRLQDTSDVPTSYEEWGEALDMMSTDPHWQQWLQDTYDILEQYGCSSTQYCWEWMTAGAPPGQLNEAGQIWTQNMLRT